MSLIIKKISRKFFSIWHKQYSKPFLLIKLEITFIFYPIIIKFIEIFIIERCIQNRRAFIIIFTKVIEFILRPFAIINKIFNKQIINLFTLHMQSTLFNNKEYPFPPFYLLSNYLHKRLLKGILVTHIHAFFHSKLLQNRHYHQCI